MRVTKRIGLTLATVLLAGVTSCTSSVDQGQEPSNTNQVRESTNMEPPSVEPTSPQSQSSPTHPATVEATTSIENHDASTSTNDSGDTTCDDAAIVESDPIPQQLAELGVPFYECVHQMVAMAGSDPLFVGEYDTLQESIIVEMSIKDQFDASEWNVTNRMVDGDNAITQAQMPGYSLVVAIGPSRSADAVSSIHYTLREQ